MNPSHSITRAIIRAGSALALLPVFGLFGSDPALAQSAAQCSDYGGVLDGFAGDIAPANLEIDQNCTVRNYPGGIDTNFNFFTQPGQTDERWLIVFDNVIHNGQMSCNAVHEHKIWFVNGSLSGIHPNCQNLLIPVEKIDKQNPAGQTTASVGVPFTYTLTSPILFDAGTGTVINNQGSLNDLHSIVMTDDLNATGVDLSYVSHTAYWRDTGDPVTLNFSDVGGFLTFDGFPIIPAGDQIVIELTVVLEDTPTNSIGTQFSNTAKWEFGRLIDDVFYEPLPGEWGISPPLTIDGPDLILTKTGPNFLNLGEVGVFTLDVRNIGGFEAWNVTIDDELPLLSGAVTGGMCDFTPVIVDAQVFAADGVTPVPGKGPLSVGTDLSMSYTGAPQCFLQLTALTAAAAIGAGERLIINYQSVLDADTDDGAVLTNVAGATEWFNGPPSVPGRQSVTRTLTDGTPGTLNLDHEDSHTVVAALFGSYFNKTVVNVTSGQSPATIAAPGDTLHYTLQMRTTDSALTSIQIVDDLGALNPTPVYAPGTLTWVQASLPAGADTSNTNAAGGTNGTGYLDIRNFDLPADSEISIEFEIQLAPIIPNATLATNQATLTADGAVVQYSDDPFVNGQASPDVDGDEDPTQVQIVSAPNFDVDKISAYLDGDPTRLQAGERVRYTITVANIGTDAATDAVILDQIPADTSYVADSTTLNGASVADLPSGDSPLTTGMPINATSVAVPGLMPADPAAPADNVATITFDVLVDPNAVDGTIISNQAFVSAPVGGVTDQPSDDPRTPLPDDPTRDIVGSVPLLYAEKSAALYEDFGAPGIVDSGDILRYTITVYNNSTIDATQALLTDAVPTNSTYVANSTTINGLSFGADGGVSPLIAGLPFSSSDLTSSLPTGLDGTLTAGEAAVIEFDVLVDAGLPAGTLIVNQATVTTYEAPPLLTDGDGDPSTGPEATVVVVGGAPVQGPYFDIDKTSAYLDGDPNRLLAGERLRYTITIANIGTYDATDTFIVDQIPANTTYVAGSTTLNGAVLPDLASGFSPLTSGMPVNAAGVATPGLMPDDVLAAPDNVATITFDVLVDPDTVDGTIISNQAFVSAPDGGVSEQPSDDPRTEVVDDPTRDIVGNLPLLYAEKSAALHVDLGSPGVVDPGDTLRYTITVYNNSDLPATQAQLTDAVPTNSIYVEDSTTLNGETVGPDSGVSPLIAGLPISTSDLTPPLPGDSEGTLTPGESAVIEFDVLVDAVPAGTLIVNQATVSTYEVPTLLTDGDGNPATGPEPTVVVVGPPQRLSITKQVAVVGGGPAYAGSTLEYTVRVLNIAQVPASYVQIYDDLDVPVPGYLTYVPNSATMNGSVNGVVFAGSLLTADYAAEYGDLAPGAEVLLRFQAVLDANLQMGTIVTNTAEVQWNDPTETLSASVSVTIGGIPGAGILSGSAWHDVDFDDVFDTGETALEAWTVELYQAGDVVHTTETDAQGFYRISGIPPATAVEDRYEIVFRAPDAGANTAALGRAFSDFTNGMQRIADISVEGGANLADLHLPIDPNGVVYNAVARAPLSGSTLTMLDAVTGFALPPECFDDPQQQDQVTRDDGFYKFDINFSEAACPEGGDYLISVTPPTSGNWVSGTSQINPPATGPNTVPLSVPGCLQGGLEDAIPTTTLYCEATTSALTPPTSVPSQTPGTVYYLHLTLDNTSNPGSRQIFNNHIPLDPDLANSVTISKTSPVLSVRRGDLVPYIITVTNDVGFDLSEVSVVDRFPVGFRYIEGSARLDGDPLEPVLLGNELAWSDLELIGAGTHRIDLLLAVGSGVSEGEFVNRAQVIHGLTGNALSSEATATVRLVPDPDFDCTDVMGKVYNDANRNGIQEAGEDGIPGVRLVTANGLAATTDEYGRYHITCATVPNENRGSNFVMKLDDRTLPSGFRASSDGIQIARATRGKALRFNFGASIHRVIGIDLADPIFEVGRSELRPQWRGRVDLLMDQLQAAPAVLRLSYLADLEEPRLVRERLDVFEDEIRTRWEETGTYELEIEPEIFWRRGEPAERGSR